jgi:hypothetical protein
LQLARERTWRQIDRAPLGFGRDGRLVRRKSRQYQTLSRT